MLFLCLIGLVLVSGRKKKNQKPRGTQMLEELKHNITVKPCVLRDNTTLDCSHCERVNFTTSKQYPLLTPTTLKHITTLDFSHNFVSHLTGLDDFTALQRLIVTGNTIHDVNVDALAKLTSLRELDISLQKWNKSYCIKWYRHSGKSFSMALPHLQKLNILQQFYNNNWKVFTCYTNLIEEVGNFAELEKLTMTLLEPYHKLPKNIVHLKHLVVYSDYHSWEPNLLNDAATKVDDQTSSVIVADDPSIPCAHNDTSVIELQPRFFNGGLNVIARYTCIQSLDIRFQCKRNIKGCKKKTFSEKFFNINERDYIAHLQFLNLSYSCLYRLPMGYQHLPQLLSLDMKSTDLKHIGPAFLQFPRLQLLDLSNNTLFDHKASQSFWSGIPNLRHLYLNDMGFSQIPPDFFNQLQHIETLSLCNNGISEINFNISHMKNITFLNLARNKIQSFNQRFLDQLDSVLDRDGQNNLVKIDLSENHLVCECSTLAFLRIIKSNKVQLSGREKCVYFDGRWLNLTEVNVSKLHRQCVNVAGNISHIVYVDNQRSVEDRRHLVPAVLLPCLLITAVIITAVISCRYKWTIRWLFYKWKSLVKLSKTSGSPVVNRQYHAFVSHNHSQDFEWVQETLLAKIENEWGLSLCIGQRDFTIGTSISDNIVRAVMSSNYTLIILTPGFIQSKWCDFELQMALTQGYKHIIIIYFKEVAFATMSSVMKRLVKTVTYLEYPTDGDGIEVFWRRLQKALITPLPSSSTNDNWKPLD